MIHKQEKQTYLIVIQNRFVYLQPQIIGEYIINLKKVFMPVKIRLARHGRKARPIYHVVVADSRAPRDGRYIEKLGLYNPNTNPASLDLDFEKALDWLQKGAQPTDTARSLLSREGVLMKKHLLDGAKKGAFSEEEAEKRFEAWLKDKKAKLQGEVDKVEKAKADLEKEAQEREAKVNADRAAEIAKRKADEQAAAAPAEEATEEAPAEAAVEVEAPTETEAPAEEPKAEEAPAEKPKAEEAPAEESKAEETPAEEPKAEAKEEKAPEAKEEDKKEE